MPWLHGIFGKPLGSFPLTLTSRLSIKTCLPYENEAGCIPWLLVLSEA